MSFGSRLAEVGDDIILVLRERCPEGVAQIDPVSAKPGDVVRSNVLGFQAALSDG